MFYLHFRLYFKYFVFFKTKKKKKNNNWFSFLFYSLVINFLFVCVVVFFVAFTPSLCFKLPFTRCFWFLTQKKTMKGRNGQT